MQVFLFYFLLFELAQPYRADIISRHGLLSSQLSRRGLVNANNSTGGQSSLASTQSNKQLNNSQTVTTNATNSGASATTANNSPTQAALNSTSTPKLVFAHFIVGLTYSFTQQDWLSEMSLAASHGIDAFALNVGAPESWQVNQVSTAYDAATQVHLSTGQPFKLFLSLDMSVISTSDQVSTWVSKFGQKDSQLLVNGKVFISTFSGENNLFGANNLTAGWTGAVKSPLAALNPPMEPLFIPVWSGLDPNTAVSANPIVDGIMTWKAWPTGTAATSTAVDLQFQADAKKINKYYMAAVSPCFYTHYSDKNFLYRSDDNLYLNRWKDLIAMQTPPDFIEIISWNDYGESHYIGPIHGSLPNGTTWIQGFDHQAWLDMTDYFISWYKTGSPPAINQDKVYYSYRPHSVTANASSDSLGPPTNASSTTDAIYLAAFLTSTSTARKLKVSLGDLTQNFTNLNLGSISTFSLPWNGTSGGVRVELLDDSDKSLLVSNAPNSINNTIEKYNFNYASEVLMKNNTTKSHAKSGSSNISSMLNVCTIYLGVSIALFSNLIL